MQKTARVGDKGDHPCTIITGDDTHILDGQKIARVGDLVNCKIHGVNKIIAQCADTLLNGNQKTAHLTSITQCGAKIITGSETQEIDNLPPNTFSSSS